MIQSIESVCVCVIVIESNQMANPGLKRRCLLFCSTCAGTMVIIRGAIIIDISS